MNSLSFTADLHRQAVEQLRARYDGHGRRTFWVSARQLAHRRARRRANAFSRDVARVWE